MRIVQLIFMNSIYILSLLLFLSCSIESVNNDKSIVTSGNSNSYKNYNNSNSGLLNNYIQDVQFDSYGNAWICSGTTYGGFLMARSTDGRLIKYDGINWKYYENPFINESERFYDNIFIDKSNNIWCSVSGANGYTDKSYFTNFNIQSNEWKYFEFGIDTGWTYGAIELNFNEIMVYGPKNIWIYKDQLAREIILSEKNGPFFLAKIRKLDSTRLISRMDNGLVVWSIEDNNLVYLKKIQTDSNKTRLLKEIIVSSNGMVWASHGTDLMEIDPNANTVKKLIIHQPNIDWSIEPEIFVIKEDNLGNLLAASHHYMFKRNPESGDIIIIRPKFLIEDRITCISFDQNNNLWVGTKNSGLYIIKNLN